MNGFTEFFSGLTGYATANSEKILELLGEHIQLTFVAVIFAILVGIPLGLLISRYDSFKKPVLGVINIIQAVPSMAVLGFMIPIFGIGYKPAIIMVMLYALLPIVKNTSTGLEGISEQTLEVAKGIGMTGAQILFKVQFPLAMPVIMAGVRISAVTAVGLMTLASYIGAGGLGYLIYSGVQMVNPYMILAGAIPACLLALLMDWVFAFVEKWVTPLSLRAKAKLPANMQEVNRYNNTKKWSYRIVSAVLVIAVAIGAFSTVELDDKTVSVTSKYYPEQLLLGNMASDLIEAHTDLKVNRKLNMGGTDICLNALTSGEVDIQVEYTGSMYASVLKQPVDNVTADHIYNTVKEKYDDIYKLTVLDDWGFNNTYSLAVRKETAEKYHLETISDLAKVASQLTFTPTFEFSNREDGMLGLNRVYEMQFGKVVPMDGGLRYTAIDNKECDVIVAYTTDAMVFEYGLVMLKDDKNFFLPYHAVPVIRQDILEKYPELEKALNTLSNELTDEIMSELNYRIEVGGETPEEVSKSYLKEKGYI